MSNLLNFPLFQAIDGNGNPIRGGLLYTYEAGTTTAKYAYSDRACSVAHTNPIVLDSEGRKEIYLKGNYKLNLKTSAGAQVPGWPVDNIEGIDQSTLNYYFPASGAADQGVTGDSNTLKYYIDTIGANTGTIYFSNPKGNASTTYTLSTNETVPTNVKLIFDKGAIISVGSGITLTVTGQIDAGLYQIFSGSGTVTFGSNRDVYPEWWATNTTPGTTNMGAAMQSAIDSITTNSGSVRLSSTTYLCTSIQDLHTLVKIKSNVSVIGNGPKSVVKAGPNILAAGQGISLFYSYDTVVSDVLLKDFCIDYNGANNPWSAGLSSVTRTGCSYGGENFTIDNVLFQNSPGTHFIYISDQSIGAGTVGYEKAKVTNCYFDGCGRAIDAAITDHTSCYMDANGGIVADNIFRQPNTNDTKATCIDVHSSDVSVTGNTCYYYHTFCNVSAEVRNTSHVTISGNTARGVVVGIATWSADDFVLSYLNITGNNFGVRDIASPAENCFGILSQDTMMLSTANGSYINISGNQFYSLTINDYDLTSIGVCLYRWDNISITGNQIYNFTGEGIYLADYNSTAYPAVAAQIKNNQIRNVGLTTVAADKRGIAVIGSLSITNVQISGNQIILAAGGGTVASWGITISGTVSPLSCFDNLITGAGTNAYSGLPTSTGNSGVVTLTANAAATTVTNTLVKASSHILLFPTSANASADVGSATGVYVSAKTEGTSFVITHPNNANADKTFDFLIVNC